MKNHIDSYTFWGDNVEIFHSLIGFKIEDIEFTNTNEEKEPVIILGCVNEHHVRIDLLLQEDGVFVSEPYMEESFVSVKAILNNLLLDAPCPYCEKEEED